MFVCVCVCVCFYSLYRLNSFSIYEKIFSLLIFPCHKTYIILFTNCII